MAETQALTGIGTISNYTGVCWRKTLDSDL